MGLDERILLFIAAHREPVVTEMARAIAAAGTSAVVLGLAALGGLVFVFLTPRWRLGAAAAGALAASDVAARLLKQVILRPRPSGELSLLRLSGWAMPSIHVRSANSRRRTGRGLAGVTFARPPRAEPGRGLAGVTLPQARPSRSPSSSQWTGARHGSGGQRGSSWPPPWWGWAA